MLNFPGVTVYLIIMYIEKQHRNLPCWVEFLEQNIRLFPTCSSIPYVFFLLEKIHHEPQGSRKLFFEVDFKDQKNYLEDGLPGLGGYVVIGSPSFISHLVGGFSPTHLKNMLVKLGSSSQGSGWKFKTCLKPPPSHGLKRHLESVPRCPYLWSPWLGSPLTGIISFKPRKPKQSPFPSLPFPIHQLDTWNDSHQKSMRKKQDMKKNGATRRTPGGRNPWSWWGDCWTCTLWEIPILGRYFWVIIHKNPLMVVVGGWLLFSKTRIPPALFAKGL